MRFFRDFSRFFAFFRPILTRFLPDFTQFSKLNNFSNFDARNFLDHLNKSPESALSESSISEEITKVDQKFGRGRKLRKNAKIPKIGGSEDRSQKSKFFKIVFHLLN